VCKPKAQDYVISQRLVGAYRFTWSTPALVTAGMMGLSAT
jgi:hypothetical protein